VCVAVAVGGALEFSSAISFIISERKISKKGITCGRGREVGGGGEKVEQWKKE
jgi:hypothetical protein